MYVNIRIKKCPLCGGDAILEKSHRSFRAGETKRVTFVRCGSCGARGPRFWLEDFGHTSISKEASEKAIECWNRRTSEV